MERGGSPTSLSKDKARHAAMAVRVTAYAWVLRLRLGSEAQPKGGYPGLGSQGVPFGGVLPVTLIGASVLARARHLLGIETDFTFVSEDSVLWRVRDCVYCPPEQETGSKRV